MIRERYNIGNRDWYPHLSFFVFRFLFFFPLCLLFFWLLFLFDLRLPCVCVVIGTTCNIYMVVFLGWQAVYSRFFQARVVRHMNQYGPGTSKADSRFHFSIFMVEV